MKKNTVLTLSMLIVLISSMIVSGDQTESFNPTSFDEDSSVSLNQQEILDQYFPILIDVLTSDTKVNVRERNDTLGEGAITKVQAYTNVTFRYAVALENTTVFDEGTLEFRLFADLPRVNTTGFNNTGSNVELSLTDEEKTLPLSYTGQNTTGFLNYSLPFLESTVVDNATLYFFETSPVNMSVSYLPFFVEDVASGFSELDSNEAYNLLTTEGYAVTSSQDEFYIQNEKVNIFGNISLVDNGTDGLGISFRVNSGSSTFLNFSLTFTGNNGSANLTISAYEPGTTFSWNSRLFIGNDTLLNHSRLIRNLDVKSVEIGDGTPELVVTVNGNDPDSLVRNNTIYSQNSSITYTLRSTVPKGNITSINLFETSDDVTPFNFAPVNGSLENVQLVTTVIYTSEGVFNTTLFAETDKGLSLNITYTVFIDRQAPTIGSFVPVGGNNLETEDGLVTFAFNFADDNAGIKVAILNLGDGKSYEVTDMEEFNHRFEDFGDNFYSYTLTVIDLAGNMVETGDTVFLSSPGIDVDRAPSFAITLFFIVLVALFTSPIWGPRVIEIFQDRF